MIPKSATLRVARPTDNLAKITEMYVNGLGFKLLGSFEGHNGFDGSIIGHKNHNYHADVRKESIASSCFNLLS